MEITDNPDVIRDRVLNARRASGTVGYVPTMGALHQGHRRVIREARNNNSHVAVSIFVNSTQFDTDEDAEVYPRQSEEDQKVLLEEDVDFLFEPEHEDMYPEGDVTSVNVDLPLTERYEGEIRPRFFHGVARIVSKLFNILPADNAYFGEKDLQQFLMLRRMVRDLHFPQTLHPVPVERDEDGVAFSSRNQKFSDEDWEVARSVYSLMQDIKENAGSISRSDLETEYTGRFKELGLDLQYLDVVTIPEYEPTDPDDSRGVLILAGHVNDVRLKDNLPLHVNSLAEMSLF